MRNRKTDCEVIEDSFEDVFSNIGECFNRAVDEKHSKMSVVKGLFGLGRSVVKLSFDGGKCAIKQTPKVIATVAAAKREVVTAIEEEVTAYKKQAKEDALDEKIRALKIKKTVEK